jgi:hypothetical protein
VAGRERKRGECQTPLGLVWRETGAVRNASRSRGQAASTRKGTQWKDSGFAEMSSARDWLGYVEIVQYRIGN